MGRPLTVGINGKYHAGKDTACTILERARGVVRVSLSDIIKRHAWDQVLSRMQPCPWPDYDAWFAYCEAHKYDAEGQPGAWVRKFLQGYGQLYRSLVGDDYWVRLGDQQMQAAWVQGRPVIIPSFRFPNEVPAGTVCWRLDRPGAQGDTDISETALDGYHFDAVIANAGDLAALERRVLAAFDAAARDHAAVSA